MDPSLLEMMPFNISRREDGKLRIFNGKGESLLSGEAQKGQIILAVAEVAGNSSENISFAMKAAAHVLAGADHAGPTDDELIAARSTNTGDVQIVPVGSFIRRNPQLRPVLIDGIARRGEVINIVAAPKTGKTIAMLNLAVAMATGGTWFGFKCVPCNVLLIDNELHTETLADRIARITDYRGLRIEDVNASIDVLSLRGKLRDLLQMRPMIEGIEPGKYGAVVFDSLYRSLPRDCDENSNVDITQIYNLLDYYASHLQAAIFVVHHTSKGIQGSKGVTDVGAGAGAQSRAADTHIVLRQHEQPGVIVFDAVNRSFMPVQAACWRLDYPIFVGEPLQDPSALKREGKGRGKKDDTPKPPKPEPWTYERFASRFITQEPKTLAKFQAEAGAERVSARQVKDLLDQAVAMKAAYEWAAVGGANGTRKRWATVPQPLIEIEADSSLSLHTHSPHTPRVGENAPRGGGGAMGRGGSKPRQTVAGDQQ